MVSRRINGLGEEKSSQDYGSFNLGTGASVAGDDLALDTGSLSNTSAAVLGDSLTAGDTVLVEFEVKEISAGSVRVLVYSDTNIGSTSNITTAGHVSQVIHLNRSGTAFLDRIVVQAAAGTAAVVGPVTVKKIPGTHLVQSTNDNSRPIYAIEPKGGVRNLLTFTEDFDNSTWIKTDATVSAVGGGVWVLSATANSGSVEQLQGFVGGQVKTFSVEVRAQSGTVSGNINVSGAGAVPFEATTEWQRIATTVDLDGNFRPRVRLDMAGDSVELRFPQNELGSAATPYQRVVSQYEVTEDGVPTVHKIVFDGVDDYLQTSAALDMSASDKVTVWAGVHKAGDAARGMIVELGANQDGAFLLDHFPPSARYRFGSRGTIFVEARTLDPEYDAPTTNVLAGIGDISGDVSGLRLGGSQVDTASGDQGAGSYGDYPLNVGARGGSSLFFDGSLYSLVIRGGPSSAAEIESTERHVANKTGVDL